MTVKLKIALYRRIAVKAMWDRFEMHDEIIGAPGDVLIDAGREGISQHGGKFATARLYRVHDKPVWCWLTDDEVQRNG